MPYSIEDSRQNEGRTPKIKGSYVPSEIKGSLAQLMLEYIVMLPEALRTHRSAEAPDSCTQVS